MAGFDAVHQLLGFAIGWHEIEPTARDHQVRPEPKNAIGNRIAMVMIVKEPGVEVALTQRQLDAIEIHEGILNPASVSSLGPCLVDFAQN